MIFRIKKEFSFYFPNYKWTFPLTGNYYIHKDRKRNTDGHKYFHLTLQKKQKDIWLGKTILLQPGSAAGLI